MELLKEAELPAGAARSGPLGGEAGEWFADYRPEDDWPWLVLSADPASVARSLVDLLLSVGVPTRVVQPDDLAGALPMRRVLVFFGLDEALGPAVARLVAHCERHGCTLVATSQATPYGTPGLEERIGDDACLTLLERARVLG